MEEERPWFSSYPKEVPRHLDYPAVPLTGFLAKAAAECPDRVATIFFGGKLTYRRLETHVRRFAAGLQQLGVKPGDRVAVMLPNCPQAVIAYLAVLTAGAVVVQTNPMYKERELRHQLADSGATQMVALDLVYPRVAAVTSDTRLQHTVVTGIQDFLPVPLRWLYPLKQRLEKKRPAVDYGPRVHRFLDVLAGGGAAGQEVSTGPGDLALLQYTGGTTGVSKGVMLTHANLVANVSQIAQWMYGFKAGTPRILAALPLFHSYGLTACMNFSLHAAGTLILTPKFDVEEVLKLIQRHRPTVFPGAPTMYVALNHHPRVKEYDLSSIETCISGGAALPVEVQETFERLTGGKLVEGYGLTEASPVTHCTPLWGKRKNGSIGVPWPDTDCRIVDGSGVDVAPGEIGELLIKGPQVMRGYWNHPEETAATLKDGWLYTGDLARMDEDGFFYIVGRKKEMIIAGGFNIYPRDVEEVLFEHPAIAEASVIGVPDPYRGETVKAYIVLKQGASLTAEEVDRFCRERLAAYKVPRIVEFRTSLPKSMVGKVLRRELLEEEAARLETSGPGEGG